MSKIEAAFAQLKDAIVEEATALVDQAKAG